MGSLAKAEADSQGGLGLLGSGSFRLYAPRMVEFYDLSLFPVARALGPALGIKRDSLLMGLLPDCTDSIRLAVIPLI